MINKRVFGSEIPIAVKKKLEARQLVAGGTKNPTDAIKSEYPDSRNEGGADGKGSYSYKELIANNFDMQADLSSRTPFARMWVGVSLFLETDFVEKPGNDNKSADKKNMSAEETKNKDGSLGSEEEVLNKIDYKELSRKIYAVGTNNLSTIFPTSPLETQQSDTTEQAVFPGEHGVTDDMNKFMKPQAGITSVSSETEGMFGSIKKTTVNFIVHNFADYDVIYNKYFLRPGATIFVDFGWDTLIDSDGNPILLYSPQQVLVDDGTWGGGPEGALYGELGDRGVTKEGFVTQANGDMETIMGIVTDYDSKILENGSVECSVTLTSKNSALRLSPKYHGNNPENTDAKFQFEIDSLIFVEQSYVLGNDGHRQVINESIAGPINTQKANASLNMKDELAFKAWMESFRYDSFGAKQYQPINLSYRAGLFIASNGEDAEDSYISWGLLEDRIFNKYFGHGDDATSISEDKDGKMSIKLDSSVGFTRFDKGFIDKQNGINEAPNFIVPSFWDHTYSFDPSLEIEKSGLSLQKRADEMKIDFDELKEKVDDNKNEYLKKAKNPDEYNLPWEYSKEKDTITAFDREIMKRVPIREIFINTQIVKNAFMNNDNQTFKAIIEEILDEINKESYRLWDWKTVSNSDNTLSINDMNYSEVVTGKVDQIETRFDKIFKFRVMGKDSIVKAYNVGLSMPEGEIGSMYAIQALTGTPGKMYPVSEVIENHAALQGILKQSGDFSENEIKTVGIRYLPIQGAYNALNISSDLKTTSAKKQFSRDAIRSLGKIPMFGNPGYVGSGGIQKGKLFSLSTVIDDLNSEDKDENSGNLPGGGHQPQDRIITNQLNSPYRHVGVDEFYQVKITGNFSFEKHYRSIPLPMTLTLTVYGISTLKPGDIFRVDYLPEVYLNAVYFQTMKVSHDVNSDGWYTTLETQFRISPHRYESATSANFPTALENPAIAEEKREKITAVVDTLTDNPYLKRKAINSVVTSDEVLEEEGVCDLEVFQDEYLQTPITDESYAYVWAGEATAFTTRAYGIKALSGLFDADKAWIGINYHRRSKTYFPPSNYPDTYGGKWNRVENGSNWDYVKGIQPDSPLLPAYVKANFTQAARPSLGLGVIRHTQIITNKNFQTLLGYIVNVRPHPDEKKYDHFSRLFTAEIAHMVESPVYVANPCYKWDDKSYHYNGYGNWSNTYYQNGENYTYVGGVYMPSEPVYLIINAAVDATMHWALIPQFHWRSGEPVDLSHYDVDNRSPYWQENEGKWREEGWEEKTGMPSKY
jgi:hypothetical protein